MMRSAHSPDWLRGVAPRHFLLDGNLLPFEMKAPVKSCQKKKKKRQREQEMSNPAKIKRRCQAQQIYNHFVQTPVPKAAKKTVKILLLIGDFG